MRLHFATMTRPRLVAKALHKAMKRHGEERPLAECQEIAAKMFGYAAWFELGQSHAAGPVSLDDAVVPSLAGYRHQTYVRVLADAGIAHGKAESIVAATRPSDRSKPLFVPPNDFPRLLVEAYEDDENGKPVRPLGPQDLTLCVIGRMLPYRSGPLRPYPSDPTVQMLSDGLDRTAREVGYRGRLALPGLASAIVAFLSRVGEGRMHAFKERLDRIGSAERALETAAVELERVRHAEFSDDLSRCEAYVLHDGEFAFERDDGWYWDWEWDAYVKAHPRPPFDSPEAAAWDVAHAAFVTANAPPYVYATRPVVWDGVDPEDVRIGIEEAEGGEYIVDHLLENEMSEHFEDAIEHIVDVGGLQAIADTWQKTPKRRRRFERLAREIAAWNAKQSITSHFQDSTVILPAFPGKTKQDAVAFCERHLASRIAALADLHRWDPSPAEEPAEAFAPS